MPPPVRHNPLRPQLEQADGVATALSSMERALQLVKAILHMLLGQRGLASVDKQLTCSA